MAYEAQQLAGARQIPDFYHPIHPIEDYRETDEQLCRIERSEYARAVHDMRTDTFTAAGVAAASTALAQYSELQPATDALLAQLETDPATVKTIGEGRTSQVYAVDQAGQKYALHVFREDPLTAEAAIFDIPGFYGGYDQYSAVQTIQKAVPMAVGAGLPGLAQLAAYKPHAGVCLSQFVAGKTLQHIEPDDVPQITNSQVRHYGKLLAEMKRRKLYVDPNVGNVLWDPEAGFTIVDYHRGEQTSEDTQLAFELLVRGILAEPASHGDAWLVASPEKVARAGRIMDSVRGVARHYFGLHIPKTIEDINFEDEWRQRTCW